MTRTIVLVGARGGQGTSTTAAALAVHAAAHGMTLLVAHDPTDMAALLGIPGDPHDTVEVTPSLRLARQTREDADIVVIDGGALPRDDWRPFGAERYVVVRGPCYLALRAALHADAGRADGLIVLVEEGRSLRPADAVDTLGLALVAQIAVSPAVARTVDAGLLASRARRLAELGSLARLARRPPRPPNPTSHHPRLPLPSPPAPDPCPPVPTIPPTRPSSPPSPFPSQSTNERHRLAVSVIRTRQEVRAAQVPRRIRRYRRAYLERDSDGTEHTTRSAPARKRDTARP